MKTFTGLLLILARVFCMFKIVVWLFQQNYSSNHPISEIEKYLVFLLLDVWITVSSKQYMDEI